MSNPRYSEAAFRQIKREHLFHTFLQWARPSGEIEDSPVSLEDSRVPGFAGYRPRFYQWGAGEVGKRWLREWGPLRPDAVVDVHPRKIGSRIMGLQSFGPRIYPRPVRHSSWWPSAHAARARRFGNG